MSLQRRSIPAIPPETALVAKTAFPSGNVYMQMHDELGNIYNDELFASVYAEVRRFLAIDGKCPVGLCHILVLREIHANDH